MSRVVEEQMGTSWVTGRRAGRFYPLLGLVSLGACTSVLGIEDLHQEPRPGTGGEDSRAGTANTDAGRNAGGKNSGGGTTGAAGSATPEAGAGTEPTGGTDGTAGTGTSGSMNGDAGAGGAVDPSDPTVRGHLIDFWGHKLGNIPVQIGNTLVSTDDNGAFVVEDVSDHYDASVAFELDPNANGHLFGWVFKGLTRRDPTLQVIRGLSRRSGNFLLTPQNVTLTATQKIGVAMGGADGNSTFSPAENGIDTSFSWEGGATTQPTVHGLLWQYDADSELPTSYLAYNSTLVAFAETGKTNITLDLAKTTVDSGNLSGTATTGGGTDRENQVFVRFTTGACLRVVDESPGPNTYTYNVPSLPGSSLAVAVSEGYDAYSGPYAVIHANGLTASSKPALKIPSPVALAGPAGNTKNVNGTTNFTWTSNTNAGPYVARFTNDDNAGPYQTLWVVTAEKQTTIPVVTGGGFALQPGQAHYWNVETHGNFASVDDMAGTKGFLDPLGAQGDISGPTNVDGEYTLSAPRTFTTAP